MLATIDIKLYSNRTFKHSIKAVRKSALLTPLYKNGKYDPEIYHPVSLTSVVYKILEHILVKSCTYVCSRDKINNIYVTHSLVFEPTSLVNVNYLLPSITLLKPLMMGNSLILKCLTFIKLLIKFMAQKQLAYT